MTTETLKRKSYLLLLLPALVTVTVLILIPILAVVFLSLTNFSLIAPQDSRFIGLSNYLKMLQDARFFNSVRVSLLISAGTVCLQILIGLSLAMLLHNESKTLKWTRGVFLLPMSIPPIAVAIVWKLLFTPTVAGINYLLSLIGIQGPAWFDRPATALITVIVAYTWKWIPFVMIILLAAIESLPTDPFESAVIDGANGWQIFSRITVPMIRPTLLFVATYRIIESLKMFSLVYVMTSGGPGISTEPMNYYAFTTTFSYNQMGYGATLVFAILLIIILIVLFMPKVVRVNVRSS